MNKYYKGLFGKLFGHRFETFQTEEGLSWTTSGDYSPLSISSDMDLDSFKDKYEIRCKRCGCKS